MRLLTAAAIAVLIWASAPALAARQGGPGESPRNANYTLAATLDPQAGTITGTGLLTWRNVSARAATSLQFHLYWNAWLDPGSTWLREQSLGRNSALARRPEADRGRIDGDDRRRYVRHDRRRWRIGLLLLLRARDDDEQHQHETLHCFTFPCMPAT